MSDDFFKIKLTSKLRLAALEQAVELFRLRAAKGDNINWDEIINCAKDFYLFLIESKIEND